MINITNEDLLLLRQPALIPFIKIDVYEDNDSNKLIDSIDGLVSGSSSIDANSDIRRTFNITVTPSVKSQSSLKVNEDGLIWINRKVKLHIGLFNNRIKDYTWYEQGEYAFMDSSATYDATTNQLSLNCSDKIVKLDGTRNGQLGALEISFPAYKEDKDTGEVIEHNIIRNAIISVLQQLAKINNYDIDDIGEFYALPQYNDNYETYRENNPLWNTLPYDLVFSAGCSVLSILTTFRDLYPNYEFFFDNKGGFTFQMIPSCYYDDIVLDNSFFRHNLVSENTSINLSGVRNICEVWGKVIDADFYTEDCVLSGNTYLCSVNGYKEKYFNGDIIAVKIPVTNSDNCKININNFGSVDIITESPEEILTKGTLLKDTVYVFKMKKGRKDGKDIIKAYLLGHWQAHGLNALVDGTISKEKYVTSNGAEIVKYSKEYFQEVYNCESVELTVIPNSPFTVQKVGEILDVKTGGEFENITSDSLALSRAEYENWKNSRLTDSITITTLLAPFADVNIKVSYMRRDLSYTNQYIVKSISHDFTNATTTWNLIRFYPLYADILKEAGTHKVLSSYSHGILSKYTHDQLAEFVEGSEY